MGEYYRGYFSDARSLNFGSFTRVVNRLYRSGIRGWGLQKV